MFCMEYNWIRSSSLWVRARETCSNRDTFHKDHVSWYAAIVNGHKYRCHSIRTVDSKRSGIDKNHVVKSHFLQSTYHTFYFYVPKDATLKEAQYVYITDGFGYVYSYACTFHRAFSHLNIYFSWANRLGFLVTTIVYIKSVLPRLKKYLNLIYSVADLTKTKIFGDGINTLILLMCQLFLFVVQVRLFQ